ncbi:MAG: type VI secretion system tip protein TssI/VgrG [Ketobacteraceae bacterium]|nr:type VI secretion system tip protein TssI/VgrG [Ketobacteraceae bacterium]
MSRIPANTSRFTFELTGQPETFKVLSFRGEEGLSRLFEYRVDVLCDHEALPLEELPGKIAALTLIHPDHPRVIHGMVVEAANKGTEGTETRYQLTLMPCLYSLTLRRGHRIFQDQQVPAVVNTLLKEAGFEAVQYQWDLKSTCPVREYIVQYGETEYEFITRLLAEEGIHFHFRHDHQRHVLCFSDHNGVFADIDGQSALRYCQEDNTARDESIIYRLTQRQTVGVNSVSAGDYNFLKPNLNLKVRGSASGSQGFGELEDYRYRAVESQSESRLSGLQQRLKESVAWPAHQIELESDETRLQVGRNFSVREHPKDSLNQTFLVVSYAIEGRLPQSREALANADASLYRCRARAIPGAVAWRPALPASTARVKGVQTARVTGPENNEIYTDQYGRIKVQFHWDREGRLNETTSCWVRVSQGLAGKNWGAMALPRVGQEVIVTFEEGDPARPLVTGSVYNSVNKPPYALPKHKSRSGIKTRSTPRGTGFNEVRIEDRKGKEKLFLRAEKNLDLRVKNLWRHWVKGDHHQTVANNLHQTTDKDVNQTVAGDLKQSVGETLSFACGKDMHLKVSGAEVVQVGEELHIKGGMRTVIEAGVSLSVKVGGSFITLDPSGVAVSGPVVRINEGGGGSSARGASPAAPKGPVQPDDHNAGQQEAPPDPAPGADRKGLQFQRGSARVHTLASAARHQVPFVEATAQPADPAPTPH